MVPGQWLSLLAVAGLAAGSWWLNQRMHDDPADL
jgi:hypothetical protein